MSHNTHDFTLIPPSPVSHLTPVEIRIGLRNLKPDSNRFTVTVFLDTIAEEHRLYTNRLILEPNSVATERFHWTPNHHLAGQHTVYVQIQDETTTQTLQHDLLIVENEHRSLDFIAGAFSGFCHWSETEGRLWNDELRTFTEEDWRELIRAQHNLGMNILVPQESFRNQQYVGQHTMEQDGYHGQACYDSAISPHRMEITTHDPLEITLDEADRLGMHVFVPVGMYAWFDFSAPSLAWHKQVATELWQRYGHHPSFYGWYVSEEIAGDLGTDDQRRDELITFFREFARHCKSMAPAKPIMLATNCHYVTRAESYYPLLLENLDILCPFGFQRMPEDDLTAEEAEKFLQKQCDLAGAHFWLDMEAFNFHDDMALYPRSIDELTNELDKRQNFEKVICYQFPGMFNSPTAAKKPGGPDTVQLFNDYKNYLASRVPFLKHSPDQPIASSNSVSYSGADIK